MEKKLSDIRELTELIDEEGDEEMAREAMADMQALAAQIDEAELSAMLGGEHDQDNAIVEVHPGAGGTESQDWAEMLMRMYLRWAERRGYKTEVVNLLPGDEAGVKSATFIISGEYAYGYLRAEAGVHRLVRISPFDSAKRRHTSFASVTVTPEITDNVEIDMREEDIKVDTFRASGAGGQHVNTTDSAVRLTHIPTGVVVSCQNERSQHKNKASAMKVLKGKLFVLAEEQHKAKVEGLAGEKKDIKWGSQIRSYVLQPYQMIKDLRTKIEVGDVNRVLDGDLDVFIKGYLLKGPQEGAVVEDINQEATRKP
ncbi:Peptide chain release factor 2 @ programmed frameshift-containing [hydrothermal vent metagenome]|uniref:Peptide chain release factor 2 @ programmed frameshift-containing n=1 Tax=hydrothermal vent metagenome TaxID=652676 RepID=A0A3B1CGK7_9ZZZZ